MKKQVRIGVIGAGSIGSLFGGYLGTVDTKEWLTEVMFFDRESHISVINNDGLKLHSEQSTIEIKTIKAYENADKIKDLVKADPVVRFDYIILSVKAYDILSAMIQYEKLLKLSNWLVVLQNGIGNEDLVKKYFAEDKIIRIITSHGALLKEPGHVIHTGVGFTKIGFPFLKPHETTDDHQTSLKIFGELLSLSGIDNEIVDDITRYSWGKVFVNIGINALGALTRLINGKLLEDANLKIIMTEAVREAENIAKLKGVSLDNQNFIELTYSVAEKTYDNKNSMLQDILNNRPTEIDFINGRVVQIAKELGVEAPINEMLTNLVKGLEQSYS